MKTGVRSRRPQRKASGGADTVVTAQMWRWDGNTGNVRVVAGFPLKPGMVTSSNLGTVKLFVGGVEQSIALQPLRGAFTDGSYRSVGIQYVGSLTNSVAVDCEVRIGGTARGTADLTWQEPVYDSGSALVAGTQNRAVIVPSDSQYWCDTFVALTPLKPEALEVSDNAKVFFGTSPGTPGTLGEWTVYMDSNYPNAGTGAATYEHVSGALAAAIRADSAAKQRAYYQRFYEGLRSQMGGYFCPGTDADSPNGTVTDRVGRGVDPSLPVVGGYGLPAEWNSGVAMGLASGYLMLGWKQPWRVLAYLNNWTWPGSTYAVAKYGNVSTTYLPRFNVSLKMMFRFAAYVVHATMQVGNGDYGYGSGRDNTVASFTDDMVWSLDSLEEFQFTTANYGAYIDGVVGMNPTATEDGSLVAGRFPNFQLSVVARGLAFYYNNVDDDPRIPTWMQRLADFIIGQVTDRGTWYSMPYQQNPTPSVVTQDDYYLSFFSELFGWVYAATGSSTYRTFALRAANARELQNPSPFIPTIKAHGEYFGGHLQSAKYYIDGGALRPIAGAHPTALSNPPTYVS